MTRNFFLLLSTTLLVSYAAAAQTSMPVPRPTPPADDDVVKISTNLIQIDVTVTDSKGKPITDLKPDEIQIFENGQKQKVTNFSFVSGEVKVATPNKTAGNDKLKNAPILPSAPVRPENVRRTIAIVVDDLTMSFSSIAWVQKGLKKFVDEQIQPGDLVAIIRTGGGIGALQQFTTDKRQLYAAVDKIKFNPAGTGRIAAFDSLQAMQTLQESSIKKKPSDGRDLSDEERQIEESTGSKPDQFDGEREANEYRSSVFATGTLGALNFIVKGMNDLPGRKSVMLLSDGFEIYSRSARTLSQAPNVVTSLQRLTDLANRSSVVIYSMDTRGLVVPVGLLAEDNTYGMSDVDVDALKEARYNSIGDKQDGLKYLAKETGGFAVINQNNINAGLRKVLNDQSYYLVGYEPDDETFDPKRRRYNKFEVKVSRPGAKVRYRSGFYGVSEEQIASAKPTPSSGILRALTSPFTVNDITVRMNPVFAKDDKVGTFLKTFINVDAGDITFEKNNDSYKASFDLVAMTFGANGIVVDERARNYTITLTDAQQKQVTARGLVFTFQLPIEKAGGYQVRLAVRDIASGRVGSANQFVDIPKIKDKLILSGLVLENLVEDNAGVKKPTDPQWDTSVRRFRSGSVLRFAYDVYNPRLDSTGKPTLKYRYRLFRDGAAVFEAGPTAVSKFTSQETRSFTTTGGIKLGEQLVPGDYVLQLEVIDESKPNSPRIAVQYATFEIKN